MLAKALQGATAAADKLYIEDVMSTFLYTGNGSTQTITNGIDLSGKGGLVWIKSRLSSIRDHRLFDTARGINNFLASNTTDQQQTSGGSLTAFNSSGFDIGAAGAINTSADTYASWTFRKAAKFFDVVTYTGDGNGNTPRVISHNLGSVPGVIIIKTLGAPSDWLVYHRSLGADKNLRLNTTAAAQTNSSFPWQNTAPTSTTFTVDPTDGWTNGGGQTYVAYLFAHDAGGFGDSGNDNVISCGSYTGNGSASGPTINLGWEPQWLLFKRTDGNTQWFMHDNMREMSLTNTAYLNVADSAAEALFGSALFRLLPNGFQLNTSNPNFNASGGTYIYIAIRRGPMKTPTDATKVFSARTSTNDNTYSTGFTVDAIWEFLRSGNSFNTVAIDRLRGTSTLYTSSTSAENAAYTFSWFDRSDGVNTIGFYGSGSVGLLNFRRAPGFFDVVAYTGTGIARTVSHNLGVAPELILVKGRSDADSWWVYNKDNGNTKYLQLQLNGGAGTFDLWNNTSPTSSVFSLSNYASINRSSSTFIAYLFATCPGVSKCFNYTGTGTTLQINCGFTSGARLVLIKRTDSTGDWYIWDSARGIISANDPYFLLNSTAAEVTNTDYIDPYSAGFEISSTAPAAINANGGSYIGLAIA